MHVSFDLKGLLSNALDLMKLEKVEFSGFKGKALGQKVLDMHEEFQEAYRVFAERTYDCLDLTNAVGVTGNSNTTCLFPKH